MLSWLLTYLVHSTILLGIVAVASRFLNSRQLPLEETLWRLAVVGGVITASAQLALADRRRGLARRVARLSHVVADCPGFAQLLCGPARSASATAGTSRRGYP